MRILFALHLHRIGAKVPLTLKRLLQLATLDGAVDGGIADRTVFITPGKCADLVLVRTTDINTAPVGDPYEAIVSLGLPTNVDTVIVDGRILRRAGKFTAFDHAKDSPQKRARRPSVCATRPSGRHERQMINNPPVTNATSGVSAIKDLFGYACAYRALGAR